MAGTILGRAEAFGIAAETVDGMDVEGRPQPSGRGPTARREGPSIERRTYRFVGHHTAERAMEARLPHRRGDERWRERDPCSR